MSEKNVLPLRLGADTVQLLLPHRRPFLLVDAIESITLGEQPAMTARKMISANEPIFEGHFPGLSLWPGVYTIEGLGQTTNVLVVCLGIIAAFEARGRTAEQALEALRAIEARARLGARAPTDAEKEIEQALSSTKSKLGFAGAIDMKLVEPVFAGSTLVYRVEVTHHRGGVRRYAVEASVEGRPVARGSITGADG